MTKKSNPDALKKLNKVSGSVISPTYSFEDDPISGVYLRKIGEIAIAVQARDCIVFEAARITAENPIYTPSVMTDAITLARGSMDVPSIGFAETVGTGFYGIDGGVGLAVSSASVARFYEHDDLRVIEFTPDLLVLPPAGAPSGIDGAVRFNSERAALEVFSGEWKSLMFSDGAISGVLAPGTVSAPSLSFEGDLNTGFYHLGNNTIGFSSDGVHVLGINMFGIEFNVPMLSNFDIRGERFIAKPGTPALTSYGFSGLDETGMFLTANEEIGFSISNRQTITLGKKEITTTTPVAIDTIHPQIELRRDGVTRWSLGNGVIQNGRISPDNSFRITRHDASGAQASPPSLEIEPSGLVVFPENGAIVIPVGDNAQRPEDPRDGMFRMNRESGRPEVFFQHKWWKLALEE